jgi:probable addiction module antidote protein
MPAEKFARYDSADYLKTEEDIAAYLEAVMEDGGDDPAYVARALGVVARARNMTALAREVGMSRVGLNKALSGDGQPYAVHGDEGRQGARAESLDPARRVSRHSPAGCVGGETMKMQYRLPSR